MSTPSTMQPSIYNDLAIQTNYQYFAIILLSRWTKVLFFFISYHPYIRWLVQVPFLSLISFVHECMYLSIFLLFSPFLPFSSIQCTIVYSLVVLVVLFVISTPRLFVWLQCVFTIYLHALVRKWLPQCLVNVKKKNI